jgi:hypothetical protein
MLVPGDGGDLTGKKQSIVDANVAPQAYSYDSAPLYKERTFVFRPTGGMGERLQSSQTDHRYYYGLNIWAFGGLWGKGPLFHDLTPPTTGEVRQFIDAPQGAGYAQFILTAGQVLRRSDDTNTGQVVDDSRPGHIAQSAVRFKAQGTTPVDALYVAWDDGVLRQRAPAGTWVACVVPTGFNVNWLATVGPELVAADAANSVVRVCTNDPTVAGSWGGPIFVGNPAVPITGLSANANKLLILKADGGIYTLNVDGSVNDEVPGARVPIDLTNGRTARPWLNSIYARLGPTFWQIDMPSVTLTPIGPELQLDNASPVYGPVQAFVGWGAQIGFAAIYNPNLSPPQSFLLSYGDWQPDPNATATFTISQTSSDLYKFNNNYNGAIGYWSKRVTALGVSNASGQDRLYVGFQDGTWSYFKLVANPLAQNSGGEFTSAPASIVVPWHTGMFEADQKSFSGFTIFGPNITTTDYANLNYRISGGSGPPPPQDTMTTWTSLPGNMNYSGFRLDAPPNMYGSMLSLQLTITNYDTTRTPVFEGLGIHERIIPRFRLDYSGTIDASDWVARRDGAGIRQSGRQIREMVQSFAASPNLAVIELVDETLDSVAIFNYTEHKKPWKLGGALQWEIEFEASQFATLSVYGIISRLRGNLIQDLSGYTIDALKVM